MILPTILVVILFVLNLVLFGVLIHTNLKRSKQFKELYEKYTELVELQHEFDKLMNRRDIKGKIK